MPALSRVGIAFNGAHDMEEGREVIIGKEYKKLTRNLINTRCGREYETAELHYEALLQRWVQNAGKVVYFIIVYSVLN